MESDTLNANYGTLAEMNVDGDPTKTSRAFVRLGVLGIPAGSTVNDAKLKLCFASNVTDGRIHELRRVTSDWTETGVTWNNQPTVSATVTDSIIVSSSQCVFLTVTADVQAWVDGAANYGWRLNDLDEVLPGSYINTYATREDGSLGQRPKLDVSYHSP